MRALRRSTLAGQLLVFQMALVMVVLAHRRRAVPGAVGGDLQPGRGPARLRARRAARRQPAGPRQPGRPGAAHRPGHPGPAGGRAVIGDHGGDRRRRRAGEGLDRSLARRPDAPAGQPRVADGAGWSGDARGGRRAPAGGPGSRPQHVGVHPRQAPGHRDDRGRLPLGLGAAARRLLLPAHLPRHRAASSASSGPGCWPGGSSARPSASSRGRSPGSPSTARRCSTASPRASSPSTPSTASPWSTTSPGDCSTCPSTPSGVSLADLRIEGRLHDVLAGDAQVDADGDAERDAKAPSRATRWSSAGAGCS